MVISDGSLQTRLDFVTFVRIVSRKKGSPFWEKPATSCIQLNATTPVSSFLTLKHYTAHHLDAAWAGSADSGRGFLPSTQMMDPIPQVEANAITPVLHCSHQRRFVLILMTSDHLRDSIFFFTAFLRSSSCSRFMSSRSSCKPSLALKWKQKSKCNYCVQAKWSYFIKQRETINRLCIYCISWKVRPNLKISPRMIFQDARDETHTLKKITHTYPKYKL